MTTVIRKQKKEAWGPDKWDTLALSTEIERRAGTPEASRVEAIRELLSTQRRDLPLRVTGPSRTRLNALLNSYQWVRRMVSPREGFRVICQPAALGFQSDGVEWECRTVGRLLDLVPVLGDRPRERRCASPACNEWFFAEKRADQRYCSGKCRQYIYDNDPVRRAAKNKKMKENYLVAKDLEGRGKQAVGFAEQKMSKKSRPAVRSDQRPATTFAQS